MTRIKKPEPAGKIWLFPLDLFMTLFILGIKFLSFIFLGILHVFLIFCSSVVYLLEKAFLVKPIVTPPDQATSHGYQYSEERKSAFDISTDTGNLKMENFERYRRSENECCAFLIPYVVNQWEVMTPVDQVVRNAYESIRFNANIPNENGVRKCTALIWKSDSAIGVIELQVENKWEIGNIQNIKISFYRPAKGGGEVKVNIQLRETKKCFDAFINHTSSTEETESDALRLKNLFGSSIATEMEDQGYNC